MLYSQELAFTQLDFLTRAEAGEGRQGWISQHQCPQLKKLLHSFRGTDVHKALLETVSKEDTRKSVLRVLYLGLHLKLPRTTEKRGDRLCQ